jgi:phage/plasmid primase-like uncharacterized protein
LPEIEASVVKAAARGKWADILSSLAPELQDALGRGVRHGPCPKHGGIDGFRFFKDFEETGGGLCNTCGTFADGISMLRWVNGWGFPECLRELAEYLDIGPAFDSENSWRNDTANLLRLQTVWMATVKDTGIISTYLKSRGLSGAVPESIRLHPGMDYYEKDGPSIGAFPVMCAPIQDAAGQMVSIHRTYLKPDGSGKADVGQSKKLVRSVFPGATRGAAVRLGPITSKICVTEGIETGIAVQEHTGVTTLAAYSAGNLERFEPPLGAHVVEIWADNDISGAGQISSAKAQRALEERGYLVSVRTSLKMGEDWLDELCGKR